MPWTAIIIGVAALLIGALAGLFIPSPTASENKTPKACLNAIDQSEDIIGEMGSSIDHAVDGIEGYMSGNPYVIREATEHIDDSVDRIAEIRPSYQSNREECRSNA